MAPQLRCPRQGKLLPALLHTWCCCRCLGSCCSFPWSRPQALGLSRGSCLLCDSELPCQPSLPAFHRTLHWQCQIHGWHQPAGPRAQGAVGAQYPRPPALDILLLLAFHSCSSVGHSQGISAQHPGLVCHDCSLSFKQGCSWSRSAHSVHHLTK